MPALCRQCGKQSASVRVSENDHPASLLCDACFHVVMKRGHSRAERDLARFFTLLAHPRPRQPALALPSMPDDAACPDCGLRYPEFAAHGMAGCARCYGAFAAALLPALESLRG